MVKIYHLKIRGPQMYVLVSIFFSLQITYLEEANLPNLKLTSSVTVDFSVLAGCLLLTRVSLFPPRCQYMCQ